MGHAVEAGPERIRCYLRRPVPGRRDLLTQMPETPFARQTPAWRRVARRSGYSSTASAVCAIIRVIGAASALSARGRGYGKETLRIDSVMHCRRLFFLSDLSGLSGA